MNMNFLKRLFGARAPSSNLRDVAIAQSDVVIPSMPATREASSRYFDNMAEVQGALAQRNYAKAALLTRDSITLIPAWVRATRKEFGSFVIGSIPAIEQGGRAMALVGDGAGLAAMRALVEGHEDLRPWTTCVADHIADQAFFKSIIDAVSASPGCLQSELKIMLGEPDGRRISQLVIYLEKAGKLARIKAGKNFKLVPPGSPEIPRPAPRREVASHRRDPKPPKLHEIDISTLDYVPLPRAPLRWEEAQAGRERAQVAEAREAFEVRDADWSIASIAKIPAAERPDTAFRITRPSASGLFVLDDLGKAQGADAGPASVLRYDRAGALAVRKALLHDVYRFGVHPLGRAFIALSRDTVLHAYDDKLEPILETALATSPEIAAIRKRFEITDAELKNHIRCVALARDESRYLFTIVDEAWCVNEAGFGLWGAKLPIKDGWTRVATPSAGFGTSEEIAAALALMGLKFPLTPDEVKGRYRALAKQWHPDLNPSDPSAGDKMARLSAAAEILSGIDATAMPRYAGATFAQEIHRSTLKVGDRTITLTASYVLGEKSVADWIYAASFAGTSNAVYLAGYSGRVVMVDENGIGLRVYDIGAVPERIVDTGRYLYLLTQTRLYVLRENALHALIDTYEGGDLIVAHNGFGLLEKKRLRWYTPDGSYLGCVVTQDPIRRVYFAGPCMIVETRQLRCSVMGVPDWWV